MSEEIDIAVKSSVLIVESDPVARQTMQELLGGEDFHAIAVANFEDAIRTIADRSIDLIVTEVPRQQAIHCDVEMSAPSLRAARLIDWVESIRDVASHTPLILITHEERDPSAYEALMRGAASYVPRKLIEETLRDTVEQVLVVSRAAGEATEVDQCIARVKLELRLPNHEDLVPGVIAKIESAIEPLELYDEMVWTQVAMALDEAILNAMIHGNLEVNSSLREIDDGSAFWEKIAERREQEPYSSRRTDVVLMATRSQAVFIVRDQGPGYDFRSLPDPTDPANLENIGGRGLLLISAFMDEIHHNEKGNELTMIKRKAAGPRDDFE